MKVMLTGASGFIGSHVLQCLQEQGVDTVMVGRGRPRGPSAEMIEADLLSPALDFSELMGRAGATHLLHLAWYAEHGKYWESPLNLRWVDATTRLVEAFCATGGRHVVVAGTCAEYDWASGYCREDATPLDPATLYGTAKDATRRLTMALCARHGVRCAWGRVFLPYGPGEARQRLVPSLIDLFRGRRPAFGVNAGAYRDFLHVRDVAQAFVALVRDGAHATYNISSGEPVRIAELVRMLSALLGADPQAVLDLPYQGPVQPAMLAGDNARLLALGWRASMSLAQGLAKTVQDESRHDS